MLRRLEFAEYTFKGAMMVAIGLAGEPEYRKRISSGAKDSGYGAKTKSPFVHYVLRVGVLGPLLSTIKHKWWYYLAFLGVNRGIWDSSLEH